MIRFLFAALGAAVLVAPVGAAEFESIFNGKDLTGWEGDPTLWTVKDGAITGTTTSPTQLPYNKFLIWGGGPVANFELKLKFRINAGNSGVQYRSKHLKDAGEFVVGGYQADIDATGRYTGILYEERARGILAERGQKVVIRPNGERFLVGTSGTAEELLKSIDQTGWNDYHIIANGNHFTHIINGKTMMDLVDHQADRRAAEGILALQIHRGPPMVVQFKDIELKRLPEGGIVAPTPLPADAKKIGGGPPPAAPRRNNQARRPQPGRPKDQPGPGREPPATDPATMKIAKDFKVELLYSVPKDKEGSWVNLCTDPKGRLIVSDQYGGLFRVTPPPLGGKPEQTRIEKIPVNIGEAQGLLWAFDSLYVVVNKGQKYASGMYRVRDTDGDDVLDEVKLLRILDGGAEHGPHAVLLSPDKKSLYVVCGNKTALTEFDRSRVPTVWGEDHLLPRMPDGRGFMRGVLGPGGAIYNVDPEGKSWELICVGFRNEYDAAFNGNGDLFSYDADMEWDFNTPWYRPTRVCLVASGGEYGWRNGAGKWPAYYPDSLPSVVDVGPGSPTGVCFGYGARFPAKYQNAFFICDWSYGKLYATHLTPVGSSYRGELEEFVTGTPLPLTDVIVNPTDGAMYFTIGGRRTKSGLYRVTYTGKESTAPVTGTDDRGAEARAIRHKLESYHGKKDPAAIDAAWPCLDSADRFIRFAARVAIEHQDPAQWRDRALSEKRPAAAVLALLALTRVSAPCPEHRKAEVDAALGGKILAALNAIPWEKLTEDQRTDLVRVYEVLFNRFGKPTPEQRQATIARLDAHYPSAGRFTNAELCQVLVYLEAPGVVGKTLKLMAAAPTQEEQMEYARALRVLKTGWTPEQRKEYFGWFVKAAGYKGGMSFGGFVNNIKTDAVATLTAAEKTALKPLLEARPEATPVVVAPPRPVVKKWTLADLAPVVEKGLTARDFDRGRQLFGQTSCFGCHRYDNEGGAQGPDLTSVAGRFSPRDLLESILDPNKEISDQYAAVTIETSKGTVVTGRIINLNGDSISVLTNMLDPSSVVSVDRKQVETMAASKVSMMPGGLLDTLKPDEILDLLAYLLARGDRNHAMFAKPTTPSDTKGR